MSLGFKPLTGCDVLIGHLFLISAICEPKVESADSETMLSRQIAPLYPSSASGSLGLRQIGSFSAASATSHHSGRV